MNIDALKRPLGIDEIDFRVQSVNKGGYAVVLAYKDARADMIRLDEAVGPLGWKRQHLNNNANCIVSLWDDKTQQWVSKEDTGSESNTEKAKGLASDSFKRACFNWGIGRELYDYPVISVKLFDNEVDLSGQRPKATWNLKLKEWIWFSQFKDGKLTYLACKDQNGKKRFSWGTFDKELEEEISTVKAASPEEESPQAKPSTEESDANIEGFVKKPAEKEETVEEKQPTEEELEWAKLAVEYKAKVGKNPSSKMKLETLRAKVEELNKPEKEPYSAAGEPAEDEPEEVEAEDVDLGVHGGLMADDAALIPSFTNRNEFKNWALDVVKKWTGKVPEEHIEEFKELCRKQFEKTK